MPFKIKIKEERKGAADRCVSHTRHTCWHLTPSSSCKEREREREKSFRIIPALCDVMGNPQQENEMFFAQFQHQVTPKSWTFSKNVPGRRRRRRVPHDKNLLFPLSLSLFIPKWRKKFDLIFWRVFSFTMTRLLGAGHGARGAAIWSFKQEKLHTSKNIPGQVHS